VLCSSNTIKPLQQLLNGTSCRIKLRVRSETYGTIKSSHGEKRFHCDFPGCDKNYDRPNKLNKHKATHHQVAEGDQQNHTLDVSTLSGESSPARQAGTKRRHEDISDDSDDTEHNDLSTKETLQAKVKELEKLLLEKEHNLQQEKLMRTFGDAACMKFAVDTLKGKEVAEEKVEELEQRLVQQETKVKRGAAAETLLALNLQALDYAMKTVKHLEAVLEEERAKRAKTE
jgi:hypothetical protein